MGRAYRSYGPANYVATRLEMRTRKRFVVKKLFGHYIVKRAPY